MNLQIKTDSADETQAFAERIGQRLRGGEVIELISDVGGGKTTFVRGLAKGAGSVDHVSSPTFTVSKVYAARKLHIVHFDFYRLENAGLMAHELRETLADPDTVTVIEWSDTVSHMLPDRRLQIRIAQTDTNSRSITVTYTSDLQYLLR